MSYVYCFIAMEASSKYNDDLLYISPDGKTIINRGLDVYGGKYALWDKPYGTLDIDCDYS